MVAEAGRCEDPNPLSPPPFASGSRWCLGGLRGSRGRGRCLRAGDLPLKPQTVESAVNRAVGERWPEFLHAFVGDPRVVSEPQNLELGQP